MSRKKVHDKMFTIRIPSKMINEYRKFCDYNSINPSARIRKFIERELETWQVTKKRREDL